MATKQEEFYEQVRDETKLKVKTYNDFKASIATIKATSEARIKSIQADMRFIAKQIDVNNDMLRSQSLEPIEFEK